MMNKLLFFCWFVLGSIGVYGNDSILVNREWTERRTIYVKESEIDSIGEDTVIENNGIACGNDGCIKIEFLKNHHIRKIYPNGRVRNGKWILEDNILTIVYDKKERWENKKNKFIIKYRNKKGYPTLYLFETKGRVRACYIFCNYLPKDTNNTYTQVYKSNVYWEDIPQSKQDSILRHTDSDLLSLYQGKIVVSDNNESFELLDKLCHKVSGAKQALYFLLFSKIMEESDGALSEVMGEYCMRFVEKNADFVLPYLASHEELCKLYASFIATELYYDEKSLSDYKKKTLPLMKPDTKPAFETFLKRIEKESVKIVE